MSPPLEYNTAVLSALYRPSLALLTDLYQVTMAYAYWKAGVHEVESVFHLFFRKNPFEGGYALACGTERVAEYIINLEFDGEDLEYLAGLRGSDGQPLFASGFLDYLEENGCTLDVDAVPEGTVVFPHEPILRVRGPILWAQLVETPLLNLVNFETLIATKAARICLAAHPAPVMEFGLRRAQGIDGALSASRAAYVGGCSATSNVLAGRLLGIPVRGTHAHSWVMFFGSEFEAFEKYAEALPNNCTFLVDTYDTVRGVENAIRVGRELRSRGHALLGVRIDSGDLAYLGKKAREMLDAAGFNNAIVVASNDLDEHVIESLKLQGVPIGSFGVGTRLVTGHDQPALGGVYKLSAVRSDDGSWQSRIKLSEQLIKVSVPGIHQTRRYRVDGQMVADAIWDMTDGPPSDRPLIIDPMDPTRRKRVPEGATHEDLLRPILRRGRRANRGEGADDARARAAAELESVHEGIKRLMNPHAYPAGLEERLFLRRMAMIEAARGEP